MIPGYAMQVMCIAFYSCVVIVVHRIKSTDCQAAPFYTLFFYVGLVDIGHACALFWMCFEHEVIRGEVLYPITFICSLATCFCYLVNIIGNGLMAINRYSATYLGHHQHFSKNRTTAYLTATFILAAISSIPAIFRERTYLLIDGEWTFTLTPIWLIHLQRYIIIGWMIVYFIVAPVFSIMAWLRIKNFIHSVRYHKSDHTIIYFNVAHIICHFLILCFEIFEVYKPDNTLISFVHEHFYVFLFGAIVFNGFSIVFTTKRVRQGLTKLVCRVTEFGRGKVSSSNPTTQIFQVSGRF
ncbi:hypothetical protein GCK72_008134 [Caenorhabditis remanei]|uniref:Serpentine receptor class gamma n=1 Tax=Caenorhabditis remanei TaxID=31234 RepID=A0A6A5HQU8_CAERE|nr:hypothetical protein GCK72_008134 [Caenorhabditis remanei]KAF1768172.1 hypothetical protein GCK72_008134 [Caenorhabditis remanei]